MLSIIIEICIQLYLFSKMTSFDHILLLRCLKYFDFGQTKLTSAGLEKSVSSQWTSRFIFLAKLLPFFSDSLQILQLGDTKQSVHLHELIQNCH